MEKRRVIECGECLEVKPNQAQGLCNRCYRRKRYNEVYKMSEHFMNQWRASTKRRDAKRNKQYILGKAKSRILDKYKQPCQVCNNPSSQQHHIDGDNHNNVIENIKWLCPFHHAQEHRRMV